MSLRESLTTGLSVRSACRGGRWRAQTSGLANGFAQANLVVLPADWADDFLRFCQRNPKPCPLLDVTEPGDPVPRIVAANADLRTDLPLYRVWKNGVTFWEYVLQGNPNEFGGYNNLGNHYYRNKDFERALEYYRGALQTPDGKTHVWSRRNCARCCRKLGRPDEAIQYYAEAIQVATDTNRRAIKEHTEYADYLKRQGRHSRAVAEFEAILRKRPNNSHAKKMIREIRERIGAVEGSSDRATLSFSRASRSIRVSKPRSKSC
ncbi:MAG: tetratricopeptide repeat protein [Planctomycetes bacterium]|nr:tetratricopeptide repeat protein [Planctomycetota bacterium]